MQVQVHVHVCIIRRSTLATLKIRKKTKFDQNQLKLSRQHKYMYNVSGNIIKVKKIIFGKVWPVTYMYLYIIYMYII